MRDDIAERNITLLFALVLEAVFFAKILDGYDDVVGHERDWRSNGRYRWSVFGAESGSDFCPLTPDLIFGNQGRAGPTNHAAEHGTNFF